MATQIPSFPVAFLSGIDLGYLTTSLAILQLLTTVIVYMQRALHFPAMFLSIRALLPANYVALIFGGQTQPVLVNFVKDVWSGLLETIDT